jgi:hypothetical protein
VSLHASSVSFHGSSVSLHGSSVSFHGSSVKPAIRVPRRRLEGGGRRGGLVWAMEAPCTAQTSGGPSRPSPRRHGNRGKTRPHPPRRHSRHSRWFPPVLGRRPSSDPGRAPRPGRWGATAEPPPVRARFPPSSSPSILLRLCLLLFLPGSNILQPRNTRKTRKVPSPEPPREMGSPQRKPSEGLTRRFSRLQCITLGDNEPDQPAVAPAPRGLSVEGRVTPADSGRPTDFFRGQSAGLPESVGKSFWASVTLEEVSRENFLI